MDNKTFKKIIKDKMKSQGYTASGSAYTATVNAGGAENGCVVVIAPPDTKKGFRIGLCFPDGQKEKLSLADCQILQFRFDNKLIFPEFYGTTEEEIDAVCAEVFDYAASLVTDGPRIIRDAPEEWMFTAKDLDAVNEVKVRLGLAPIDPYSPSFRRENFDMLKKGGMITLTAGEYAAHKDFYDGYLTLGAEEGYHVKPVTDEKGGDVVIHFLG